MNPSISQPWDGHLGIWSQACPKSCRITDLFLLMKIFMYQKLTLDMFFSCWCSCNFSLNWWENIRETPGHQVFGGSESHWKPLNQPIELAEFLTAIAAGSAAMTRRQRYALTAPLTTLAVLGLCSRPLGQWIYPGIAGKYDIVYDGIYIMVGYWWDK